MDVTGGLLAKLKEHRKKQSAEYLAITIDDKENEDKPGKKRSDLIFTASTGKHVMPRTIDRSFQCAINRVNKKDEEESKKSQLRCPKVTIDRRF